MERKTLDKIINIIREEMMAVGNTGYQSGGDQTRAGFDPVIGTTKRNKPKYMKLPTGMRKRWSKKNGK